MAFVDHDAAEIHEKAATACGSDASDVTTRFTSSPSLSTFMPDDDDNRSARQGTGEDENGCLSFPTSPPRTPGIKLIFLDMDGPLLPFKGLRHPSFRANVAITEMPYSPHFKALLRIIEEAGGPETVKVVLSSSWRTIEEKEQWLEEQMSRNGVDMVGHTDVVDLLPPGGRQEMQRAVEISRALECRLLGTGGPQLLPKSGFLCLSSGPKGKAFVRRDLPEHWKVSSWIVIDDMPMEDIVPEAWQDITAISPKILAAGEGRKPGMRRVSSSFARSMRTWHADFCGRHFVKVDQRRGLADTPGAVEKAIRHLNEVRHC